ncbi:MAG: hypothetical protein AAFR40_07870 [Pseudomonadota bacterium]
MKPQTKIATCCYCGTRAALVMDEARHELACSACGAPLHNLKALPSKGSKDAHRSKPIKRVEKGPDTTKRKRKKKPRGVAWFIGEVFDELEDIFD